MRQSHLSGFAALAALATALCAGPAVAQDAQGKVPLIGTAGPPAPPPPPAVPPVIDNLPAALEESVARNPALLAERDRVRASDERYVQARAQYGPTLNATASYGYGRDNTEIADGFFIRNEGFSGTASLVLAQPLFTSGRIRASVEVAEAGIDFAREQLRFTESQTLLDTITAYVGVRRDAAILGIADRNLELLDQQFRDSEQRFRVREITATDLDQVVTRVETGRATVATSRGQLGVSRGEFVRAIGALPGDLQPMPPLVGIPQTLEDAYRIAEAENPLLLAARARERVSRAQVEQARADLGGTVALQGSAGYGAVTPFSGENIQTQLRGSVVVQVPLYASGLRLAALREAEAANQADWRLIDQSLRDTRQSVVGAWDQLVAVRASLDNLALAVQAAERAYEGALVQERAGARTTLDVLDLLRDLLNARAQLASQQANEYLFRANLLAAIGRLESDNLFPEAKLDYDPEVHFQRVKDKGETGPINNIIDFLDAAVVDSNKDERPYRDAAAGLAKEGIAPLPPEPAPGP